MIKMNNISIEGASLTRSFSGASTNYAQNVAGEDSSTGFFFRPGPADINQAPWSIVSPGWFETDNPTWVVTEVTIIEPGSSQSYGITISNGQFISGASYRFTAP